MYVLFVKRIIDILISFVSLIILFPILISIYVVLFFTTKGTPFFLQDRPGKNERKFKIIKFKTMLDLNKSKQIDVHNPNRITKVGAFIRKFSLDEILQLVNVLKGDMSLIGPRPLLNEYLPLYNNQQQKRHTVRPGISGWAQVNGRNAISWEQKFEYDVWYIENISFLLDIKIILWTLKKVILKEGISQDDNIIMSVWQGND